MKTIKIALFALAGSLAVSCSDLDLSPRDKAASGSWFQTAEQFELNLNALLHHTYWPMERNEWTSGNQTELDMLTDDGQNRNSPGRFLIDGVNSDYPLSVRMWDITYTGINRCNKIITELRKHEGRIEQARYDRIMANARFYRACFYARIMIHFGDPVVVPEDMDMDSEQGRESAYELTRSDMWTVLPDILKEFDDVAPILPVSYGGEIERATRGAAYGMKARFALHFASIRKWDSTEPGRFRRRRSGRSREALQGGPRRRLELHAAECLHPPFGFRTAVPQRHETLARGHLQHSPLESAVERLEIPVSRRSGLHGQTAPSVGSPDLHDLPAFVVPPLARSSTIRASPSTNRRSTTPTNRSSTATRAAPIPSWSTARSIWA